MSGLQLTLDGIPESDLISKEIKENQKLFDFDIKEYTLEFLVLKFDSSNDTQDIFIPDYQREFVWTKKQQSLFIESVLIGLPIPYIFVADIDEEEKEDADGRIEVVDGAQRIQTIDAYVNNKLKLVNLEKLPSLEGLYFKDLPMINQRRFLRTSIRMIELKRIDEDGRRIMFDRLNTGGTKLSNMEKRFGSTDSKTLELIKVLASDALYKEMTPMSITKSSRREREEYALRFFAYRKNYSQFGANNSNSVIDFINQFVDENDKIFNKDVEQEMRDIFKNMLIFVKDNFAHGFRKSSNSKSVSRIRFEATAVGSSLALNEDPDVSPSTTEWAYKDEDFLKMMRSDASNSRPKVINRIDFVKNKILGQDFYNHANQ
ncbi:DUF262 domain-containing protein [Psychrobacter sp. DAB_AL43B]|uniref:DUF262 domain-containing protein n=1 Tax=Psychrobacter sp. DAB_AL43B TaxID=1028416 RepID=UPI0009A6DFA4|nr:DUF262 domain-containing protein [Psychrobacter sp. DAB_AL43B]SLJ84462.1 hypothetical protein DABAL43B_1266 [Psychrobacter sp. DAB_AL43B]